MAPKNEKKEIRKNSVRMTGDSLSPAPIESQEQDVVERDGAGDPD